jgi:hypothetical protein
MTKTEEKVLDLVSSGKITAAEGDELLKALAARQRPSWRWIINPTDRLSVPQSLLLGAAGVFGGLLLSRWNVHFDGALDVHLGPSSPSFARVVIEQIVAWPLTAGVFWLAALAFVRRARAIDFLASVGVARLPLLAVGAMAAAMKDRLPSRPTEVPSATPALLILAALSLPAVIWMITLLFQGFRTASGLRGTRGGVLFAAAVVLAEVLSKVALLFTS